MAGSSISNKFQFVRAEARRLGVDIPRPGDPHVDDRGRS